MHPDSIHIDYGRGAVPVRIDPARARWHIVQPRHVPPLDHPREHFRTACANPLASPPLAEIIAPNDRIVITHEAFDRNGFAQGAVVAAEWLLGRKGFFTMDDVLDMH